MQAPSAVTTFLFTDIEGSSRLWEQEPERMGPALACHDAIVRAAVESHHGEVVKMSGDGVHAAFSDPLDAIRASLQLQLELAGPETTQGVALGVRCGMHAGVNERRDRDFFGTAVNRAARIMSAAHGGQVLVSQAVAVLVGERLPPGVALRDLGSVRLRDLSSPERVYQVVHPQLRQDFPALRSLETTPNNLPQQVTSFIDRERELAEVKQRLADARLLTLLGVGGIGKTRLSLQVAADSMDDYPDGVWLVELAPITDPGLVALAVASVVGVREEAGRPVIEALVKYVKDRRLLLILDNCEHLLEACAELAKQLLQAGPHLRILASSREHLRLAGEATFTVPALATPDPYEKFIHAALTQYAAARLFIDRAVAAQPAFEVSQQNAAAVAEVCQRLDGIPLAIELAASRARALSVETIAARLNDRFRLLTGGDRTALPRQQTLRALIDWSHDLLTERERTLFRRLAVFVGGWTLEAAEAIAPGGDIEGADVLDLLTHLVEKSLVAIEAEGGRYRLLDTVREYARERLGKSGEEEQVRDRHLGYYLGLAEKARPELFGGSQSTWLRRLDLERENLLSAHSWCDRTEAGAESGVRLVHAVKPYCFNRGLLGLGHRLTLEALAREGAQGRNQARCKILADAGQYCSFMGRYSEALRHLEEGLAIAREIGNTGMIARVLQPLGMASLGVGEAAAARGYLEEALVLARELGDKRELAGAINALAQLHRLEANLETAEPLYDQVVALARELGDREIIAVGLLNLAMVFLGRGAYERARTVLLEALTIAEEIGSRPAGQSVLDVCAGLAAIRREWERAARFYGVVQAQIGDTGIQRDPTDEAFLKPLIAQSRDTLGPSSFAGAEAAGRALGYDDAIAEARAWLVNRRA
ncbi:MAG TPA: tetratricopeptide repeat protein [Casimicrobiaceae bacterium]